LQTFNLDLPENLEGEEEKETLSKKEKFGKLMRNIEQEEIP